MKKFFNLPAEGLHILFSAFVGIILLIVLFGCATPTLTTLDSCDEKIATEKSNCLDDVVRLQNYYVDRRDISIRSDR